VIRPIERLCMSLVVDGSGLYGVYAGTPEEAWSAAADLSIELHVRREPHAYASVLSCAPPMYEDLWVGGKCAYKLEPVVADGGELIIYAPHIKRISTTHGRLIREIGYHVRDYFVEQMPSGRFDHVPRGVLAHSTHVKGAGTYSGGVERPRIRVCLATGLSEAECREINLEYRDPRSIRPEDWQSAADPRRRWVKKAGEVLYRLDTKSSSDAAQSLAS
jgi:nickel-dependent lactate racemase